MTEGENAVVVVDRMISVVVGASALAVALAFCASVHAQDHNVLNSTPAISLAEAREAIEREETLWAQGSIDKQSFENVLAPTFYRLPGYWGEKVWRELLQSGVIGSSRLWHLRYAKAGFVRPG